MPKARLAQILGEHQSAIAAAVTRQIRRSVPRYREVDREAMEHEVELLLAGLLHLAKGGDARQLKRMVADVLTLRRVIGFSEADLLVASLCFLPVMRRFLIRHAPHTREGLLTYDEFEALVFRLMPFMLEVLRGSPSLPTEDPRAQNDDEAFSEFFIEAVLESAP